MSAPEVDVTAEIAKAWKATRRAIGRAQDRNTFALELAVAAGDDQTAQQLAKVEALLVDAMEATQS